MNIRQFKKNVDAITYEDVLRLRQLKEKHDLKLEDLNIPLKQADEYVSVIKEFLSSLGYSTDRIEAFECRRRDGYFPYSHNKGGIEGVAYRDQTSACENTGFKGTDAALTRAREYLIECFATDNQLDASKYEDWTDEQREQFYEYECSDDDTIQFQARVMFTSETTANVDFYVSTSDSPYHRQSDDKLELEIEFKSPGGLRRQLNKILKHKFVSKFESNLREAF